MNDLIIRINFNSSFFCILYVHLSISKPLEDNTNAGFGLILDLVEGIVTKGNIFLQNC